MPTDQSKYRTSYSAEKPDGPKANLERQVRRAGAALLWEKVWPVIVPVMLVGGGFLIASWLGLWINVPRWGRFLGLAVFGLAFLYALFPFLRIRWPRRTASLARVDRDSGLAHRPATALDDMIAGQRNAPDTQALWNLHQQKVRETASQLRTELPAPRFQEKDRFAVRAAVLVAVIGAAFIAGPEKYARLAAAFDWRTEGSVSQGFRMDAWIDPPAYTGRPPLLLRAKTEEGVTKALSQSVQAPVGSFVIVRASEGAGVTAETQGKLVVPKKPEKTKSSDPSEEKKTADKTVQSPVQTAARTPRGVAATTQNSTDKVNRWHLKGDGKLILRRLGRIVATYSFTSIPDTPPEIALIGEPKSNIRGSLTLRYKLKDDYGVLSAEALFSKPKVNGKAFTGRTLVGPPKMRLGMPPATGGIGEAETTKSLADHPWAGAQVTMQLRARDEGGNTGTSKSRQIYLPQKVFVKPMARALVEQRRKLVLAPDDKKSILTAFDALMIEPEEFKVPAGIYLGLYTISKRLKIASDDKQLKSVADFIWEMALRIEEGDLSDAERALRAAQRALRDAMNRGASEQEIKRLMQQLRAAMDRFLREFAQQQMRNQRNQNPNQRDRMNRQRMITSQDLRRMLDQMERMARSGKMADAQRMLNQLQRMLENLRSARRGSPRNSMSRQMNRALNQLDQMMRDQQRLRDRTFREGQRQGGSRQQQRRSLRQQQQQLRRQLREMQRRMQQFGMRPQQGLRDAEKEMGQAGKQLGQGQKGMGPAEGAQRRALDGLRKGAQSLAQQMRQQRGRGNQAGPGDPNGPPARDTANPDPLGRETQHRGDNSRSLYDPPGADAGRRAQRILEELRRRLSDPSRPTVEMDYLERLLRRY